VFTECVRQCSSGLDLLVHAVEHGLERRVLHALAKNVERLHQRHAGLEQRRELLVVDEEFLVPDLALASAEAAESWNPASPLKREDVQAFLFQLPSQSGFTLGDVDAFDDLTASGGKPTAEFHRKSLVGRALASRPIAGGDPADYNRFRRISPCSQGFRPSEGAASRVRTASCR
jgi:hypothetical protein